MSYDHYRPWLNFHAETLACAGVFVLFAGTLLERGPLRRWPLICVWLLVAALAPWVWWTLGIGLFAGDALIASMYLLVLAAAVVVGYRWAQPPASWVPILAWVIALVAGLSATIGLIQWLRLTEPLGMYVVQTDVGERALGNLGQPNQLATLLLMGMTALLMLFEMRRLGRFAFAVCVGYLTLVLAMTQSRAALLSTVAVTLFLLAKSSKLARLRPVPLVTWALTAVVLLLSVPLFTEWLLLGEPRGMAGMTLTSDRLQIWGQVLAGIAQAPWVGYGWNQTPTAQVAGALAVPGTLTYTNAHSVVLDLVAWNGIPLGLLWTGLVAWWLWSRLRAAQEPAAVIALAALLPLTVHSLVEYPFAYAYFVVLGGLLVGVVEAFHPGSRVAPLQRRWGWALLVPWAVAGACVAHEYLLVEEDFRIVRFENMRVGQTPSDYQAPQIRLLSQLGEMLHAARARPTPGMPAGEIERLRKVAWRFPWGALHLRYIHALALNGDPQGAAHHMRVVQAIFGNAYYEAALADLRELEHRHPQTRAALELL
ncbi:PglL family O-oligosaccharyltransferase [Pseudorhodoferax sp.]|uniref:PglL family O-oligosaccharyltransferase n=1 Tax=Pseudorhodoferax sp. TaxID=1993553 RepID=UPI002DD62436|nr:Wzy polymerase domain-containing protein [Pseudorhodoferax sp.]